MSDIIYRWLSEPIYEATPRAWYYLRAALAAIGMVNGLMFWMRRIL